MTPPGRRPAGSPAGGFTLLEVLLAMSVLAVILAAVYLTVIGTVESTEHVADALAERLEAAAVADLVRRDLRLIVPDPPGEAAPVVLERPTDGDDGDGQDDGGYDPPVLTLLTSGGLAPPSWEETPPGLTRVQYRVRARSHEDGFVLERREARVVDLDGAAPFARAGDARPAVTVCAVADAFIEVRNAEGEWTAAWAKSEAPRAVRLRFTLHSEAPDGDPDEGDAGRGIEIVVD